MKKLLLVFFLLFAAIAFAQTQPDYAQIRNRPTITSKQYGVSSSKTAAQNLAALQNLLFDHRGEHIIIVLDDGDVEVSEALYYGSNTVLEFSGEYFLKLTTATANGVLLGAVDLAAYNDNGVTASPAYNTMLINPRLDCNSVAGNNGLGFRGNNHTVFGGIIKNAYYDPSTEGGKGLSVQTGDDNIRVFGTYAYNCDIAFDINGTSAGACRNIVYSGITAENCAVALSLYCQDTLANQTAEHTLAVVNGLTAINCGLGNDRLFPEWVTLTVYAAGARVRNGDYWYYTSTGGTSGATGPVGSTPGGTESDGTITWTMVSAVTESMGIIVSERGTAVSISNINVVNDSGYGTIGGFYHGNGSFINISDAVFHGDALAIINGQQWQAGYGQAVSTGQMRYCNFRNINHIGSATNVIKAHSTTTSRWFGNYFDIRSDVLSGNLLDSNAATATSSTALIRNKSTGAQVSSILTYIPDAFDSDMKALPAMQRGDWTPTIKDDAGNTATYATASGTYCRIGDLVHISAVITNIASGTASSSIRIGNLPWNSETSPAEVSYGAVELRSISLDSADFAVSEIGGRSATFVTIRLINDAGGIDFLAFEELTSATNVIGFSIQYVAQAP